MVLFFYLCNYIYEQDAGLAAQPPHLKEQRDEQMRLWRGVSKCMFTCIVTEDRFYNYAIKSAAGASKRSTGVGNFREHFWRDR